MLSSNLATARSITLPAILYYHKKMLQRYTLFWYTVNRRVESSFDLMRTMQPALLLSLGTYRGLLSYPIWCASRALFTMKQNAF